MIADRGEVRWISHFLSVSHVAHYGVKKVTIFKQKRRLSLMLKCEALIGFVIISRPKVICIHLLGYPPKPTMIKGTLTQIIFSLKSGPNGCKGL